MEKQMFCFQCEQTAGCTGCTGCAGVCGKSASAANLQDELTGALIGLARATANNGVTENTDRVDSGGPFHHHHQRKLFNDDAIRAMTAASTPRSPPSPPAAPPAASRCGGTDNYDMKRVWDADEDVRSLKSLILFGIRGMAAYAYPRHGAGLYRRRSTASSARLWRRGRGLGHERAAAHGAWRPAR
jgi:hydroxylamine reductase